MRDYKLPDHQPQLTDRRSFLSSVGGGFAGMALAALLSEDRLATAADTSDRRAAGKLPHFAPKAKQVIQIFVSGAMSQIDTFDYKPTSPNTMAKDFEPGGKVELFESIPGKVRASYWPFKQHGECGRWVSSLFPHLAECVDDMCFIHSMNSKSNVHGPAIFMLNSGFVLPGFPSMGSWVTLALGTENKNLPAFVVLPDPRGFPMNGPINWGAGFLPATFQGTALATRESRSADPQSVCQGGRTHHRRRRTGHSRIPPVAQRPARPSAARRQRTGSAHQFLRVGRSSAVVRAGGCGYIEGEQVRTQALWHR